MKKYAKIINEETKRCEVGLSTNTAFYQSLGMTEMDVEQAYDGYWYAEGYAPKKPEPTYEEQRQKRATAYKEEVDPITCYISRLCDEQKPDEQKILELLQERIDKIADIKERYPYPEESNG